MLVTGGAVEPRGGAVEQSAEEAAGESIESNIVMPVALISSLVPASS